jgi:tRNA/rRNA methyltransferase
MEALALHILSFIMFFSLLHSNHAYLLKIIKKSQKFYTKLYNTNTFEGYHQPVTKVGAYAAAREFHPLSPTIILVNPFLDQNVGSVARTMLNFGLTDLRIVQPECDIHSDNARALASGGYEVLSNAKVYDSVSDAVKDCSRVMATTIRPRDMTQVILTPNKAAEEAIKSTEKVGILFGRERSGLTNEEIALADTIITIPTFHQFSSLNLAQAVNIISYELHNAFLSYQSTRPPDVWLQPKEGQRLARRNELDSFIYRLETALDEREFQADEGRKMLAYRSVRNMFQRVSVKFPYNLLVVLNKYISLLNRF